MKYVLSLLLSICMDLLNAQTPLAIGEKLPDARVGNVLYYKDSVVRLSDFRGKALILDFWGVYCGTCFAKMPAMQQLQDQFGDSLQIILVTRDKKQRALERKNSVRRFTENRLPVITDDTVLSNLFPHHGVPTHVLIDQYGIFRAITNGASTNESLVRKLLRGQPLAIRQKLYRDSTWFKMQLAKEALREHAVAYSWIEPPDPFSNGGMMHWLRDSVGNDIGLTAINRNPIQVLQYLVAGDKRELTWTGRVSLEFEGSEAFTFPKNPEQYAEWQMQYRLCYEIKVLPEQHAQLRTIAAKQLADYTGFVASVEPREIPCYRLKFRGDQRLIKTKGGQSTMMMNEDNSQVHLQNAPLNQLIRYMGISNSIKSIAWLNDTGFSGNVDLMLNADLKNINEVNEALQKYGLYFEYGTTRAEMVVIRRVGDSFQSGF